LIDGWFFANVMVNAFVIAGGLTILLSPLARKFLRNGKTRLLHLVRVLVILLIVQAGLRIGIEAVQHPGDVREVIRLAIGLTSLGAIIAIGQFLWMVIDGALTWDGRHE